MPPVLGLKVALVECGTFTQAPMFLHPVLLAMDETQFISLESRNRKVLQGDGWRDATQTRREVCSKLKIL
jgi:hypothetical protein